MGVGRTDEISEAGGVMEYVLALSYGKDSLRCLGAIKELGLPLDRIIHSEIWRTDTIPADLPPMIDFKAVADKWIYENFGIVVEHMCAIDKQCTSGGGYNLPTKDSFIKSDEAEKSMVSQSSKGTGVHQFSKQTYEKMFYHRLGEKSKFPGTIKGFPLIRGGWCQKLKLQSFPKAPLHRVQRKILCNISA